MTNSIQSKQLERFVQTNFREVLHIAKTNILAPVPITLNGNPEIMFLVKASKELYRPFELLDIKTIKYRASFSLHANDLLLVLQIYEIQPKETASDDIKEELQRLYDKPIHLECVFPAHVLHDAVNIMKKQEYITLVIVDSVSYKMIWATNTIPLDPIRENHPWLFEESPNKNLLEDV